MSYSFPISWSKELQSWYLWEIHIYGLAVAWFIVGLIAFAVALNIRSEAREKGLLNRVCAYLCLCAILRAMYLLIDPYEAKERTVPFFSRFLYVVIHPVMLLIFALEFICITRLVGQRTKAIKSFDNVSLLQFLTVVASIVLGVFEVLTSIYPTGLRAAYALLQLLYWLAHCGITISYLHCGVIMLRALAKKGECNSYHLRKGEYLNSTNIPVPKIRVTDENECSRSLRSDFSSCLNSTDDVNKSSLNEDDGSNGQQQSVKSVPVVAVVLPADITRATEDKRNLLLKQTVYCLYFTACLSLFHCAWLVYEQIARLIGWEKLISLPLIWLVIVTLCRLSELLWAFLMAYTVQRCFNRV
uniref:Proline-rich transmembrane protein 3/4 domain-containing protein n=1 Tax=Plectus sambesii TaxID=2011161 RepID=A0A914V9Z0_9BILA